MNITKNKVVSIDYTLKNDKGEILDTSNGKDPLMYIHGLGYIIQGLENALEGKTSGDSLSVIVNSDEGYGPYYDDLVIKLDKEQFAEIKDIKTGMQVQMKTDKGPAIFFIKSIEDKTITIDGNHPLAGENLHFDVTVKDVREATNEELDHGHIH